jgi:hypothetical protein
MAHSFRSRISTVPDVSFRIAGNEAVLINPKTEIHLGLDLVDAEMWVILTNTSSIQAAFDTLLQQYDISTTRLRDDLNRFIDKLLDYGLIQLESAELAAASGE